MAVTDLSPVTRALSPAQIRSVVDATARINIWSGAIRSGKTVISLLAWLAFVATAPTTGRLVMIGRTTTTVYRNLFTVLTDPNLFGPLAALSSYTAGAPTATILGREIDIIGASDAKAEPRLRGMTCVGAYVDEGTLVPEGFWTQLLGRLSVPGARLFCTTNPDNPAHWLRRNFILRAGVLNLKHWHFTLYDNPFLSEDVKANYRLEFVGLFYRRFVLGQWVAAEGAIFDMFDDTVHVVSELPMMARWLCVGIDYGTTNPFAALLIGLGVDNRLYVASEHRYDSKQAHRSKTDAEYSTDLVNWLDQVQIPTTTIRGVRPMYTIVDPSAASFITQLHRDGQLTPYQADNAVNDGIRNVASLLAMDKLRIHASCRGLIDELPGYAWDPKKTLEGIDQPIKTDDHSVDALRYGVQTTENLWRPTIMEAA